MYAHPFFVHGKNLEEVDIKMKYIFDITESDKN